MRNPWLYLVLGAVLLYVLWGLHVDATVGIDTEKPVKIEQRPASSAGLSGTAGDAVNWGLVDELPVFTG